MEKTILISEKYLLFPICLGSTGRHLYLHCGDEQIFEVEVPVSDHPGTPYWFHYYAPLPMEGYIGKRIRISGEMTEPFFEAISQSLSVPGTQRKGPCIHFTPDTGWMNDPNGLFFHDGEYHLYYQSNPFDTIWSGTNMIWGHAVSRDLLHWEQRDSVLYPDGDGSIYSGSGIVNQRGMMGLPADAKIFFYTSAGGENDWSRGKQYVQKMAISVDGGNTLQKIELKVVKHIAGENRDPKVYWHEESGAYYMVLYLEGNDFAILRSWDLLNWSISQRITIKGAEECPDLRRIPIEGGGETWLFWSAHGDYCFGTFDGFEFHPESPVRRYYAGSLAYAAQTFWGLEDVITVPWLRLENKGQVYRGAMGLPRVMTAVDTDQGLRLRMLPTAQFEKARQKILPLQEAKTPVPGQKERELHFQASPGFPLVLQLRMKSEGTVLSGDNNNEQDLNFLVVLWGTQIEYDSSSGILKAAGEEVFFGSDRREFTILVDDRILEITADDGLVMAVFEQKGNGDVRDVIIRVSGEVSVGADFIAQ